MPLVKGKAKEGRSRLGTPLLADNEDAMQGVQQIDDVDASYGDILDRYCRGVHPPPSYQLQKIHDALNICRDVAKTGSDKFDRGMRETSQKRKEVMELAREQELEEAHMEEERQAQTKKQADLEAKARPPATGARSLAPQDGTDQEGELCFPGSGHFRESQHRICLSSFVTCIFTLRPLLAIRRVRRGLGYAKLSLILRTLDTTIGALSM